MKEKIEKFLESKEKDLQELASVYPDKKSLLIDYQKLEDPTFGSFATEVW